MKTLSRSFLILFLIAGLAACDSNSVDDTQQTHRLADVSRLALVMNGAEVAVVDGNVLDSTAADNEIHLHHGEDTPLISLRATDVDGDRVDLDALDEAYFLQAQFGAFEDDTGHDHGDDHDHSDDHDDDHGDDHSDEYSDGEDAFAAFEQHDADGRWAFHIHGKQEGTTGMRLRLMHNDHADFVTPPLRVVVEGDGDEHDDHTHDDHDH